MEIRNRMADVVKLRCNACQDFMSMIVTPGWQEKLYKRAKDAVENKKNENNYIDAYEKMRDKGIQNYDVTDMDVSFIVVVVRFCQDVFQVEKATREAMIKLKDDRNVTFHSDENEEEDELYLRALISLCDLRNFVKTVDRYETTIEDDKRLEYRNKYMPMIDELQDLLDDERIQLVQDKKERKKDIQRILNSSDPDKEWMDVLEVRHTTQLSNHRDMAGYQQFMSEAAEAGIVQAYPHAITFFLINHDYDNAEYYLNQLYVQGKVRHPNPKEVMELADIYFRKLSTRPGDGQKLIDKLMERGDVHLSEDGKKYELISRAGATQGQCVYAIDVPQEN